MLTTRSLRAMLTLVVAGGVFACSSSTAGGTGSANGSPAPAARRDRTTITSQELTQTQASNLYEVVQRLHPEWLTPRNGATISGASNDVQVYLNSQRAGGSDYLKQMSLNSATTLRFFTASEAQSRFGNGNVNGVIQVVTSSRP
jgi:hypothetical protein